MRLKKMPGISFVPRLVDAQTAILEARLPGDSFLFVRWGHVLPEPALQDQLEQLVLDGEWADMTVLDFAGRPCSEKQAAKHIVTFLRDTGHLPPPSKRKRGAK
jgi:hypothetical protein